ncbi:Toxin relE [Erwinia amylovora]|uniref:Toxin relE n=2 Tax=Erwinia amylovora TaxID=552 RepID=A0A831A3W8_ERWAM|nr:Toxin relE [Erwinia amylovora ACW56400]QJQ53523.1 Toxin relE [Erwinia amylovora]CBA22395.1 Toxin relE [Erwinia amylovora CFBP1430]CCO79651.1 Toxin relE [Erwinia amylovora Ea356]CCO83455.1 Toxin relE [Erwinia amylovora Ea266]CCO87213.1 Toxin relE [Erwinia amylovora CFBP 2585]CCO91008.1 Toxin relE [Erwinia amylovora 01SFR-BO]CCO94791.1 Toxin relE [Erwinia amylovora NBRC 12687 = CFBP 1232]CCP00121.1 Toxin relE [Erwinia amylovora UPN527]
MLVNLQVESARLRDHPDCCKIKLKSSGYRLVYQVQDEQLVMLVISV